MQVVACVRGGTRLTEHHRKLGGDVPAMKRERSREARQVRKAERLGEERTLGTVLGQLLRLPIVAILQAMLDVAQKAVRVQQSIARAPRQQTALGERGERILCAADTKLGLLSTPYDLQRLGDEFDFTNTAASELDVVRVAAPA